MPRTDRIPCLLISYPDDLKIQLNNLKSRQQPAAAITSLLLVIMCAHTLANITWMMFADNTDAQSSKSIAPRVPHVRARVQNNISTLTSAHLFGTSITATTETKAAPVTRLNLVLIAYILEIKKLKLNRN